MLGCIIGCVMSASQNASCHQIPRLPWCTLLSPLWTKAAERHGPPCTKQGMWKQWGEMCSVFLFLHIKLRHVMFFPSCSLTLSPWSNSHAVISYFQSLNITFPACFHERRHLQVVSGRVESRFNTFSSPKCWKNLRFWQRMQDDLTSYLFRTIPHQERVHVLCIRWNKCGCLL